MCGICGQLALLDHVSIAPETIEAMSARLRHRGPDDAGTFVRGAIGLAARRLAIIDVEGGHQPIANEDGTVWAVQNGEIYNYRALRDALAARGHQFTTHSDTEVLVHLYEEHGPDFVTHLRGMFAVAVWDETEGQLVLARDRLGIKPLFVAEWNGTFAFASEIKALLAAGLPPRLDPAALHDYLSFDYVPGPRTMFDGVRKLPPAHRLIVSRTGRDATIERYWDFPPQPEAFEPVDGRDLRSGLRARLEDAVRATMVSDVPVGAFLSGGLDSSLVVALMARQSGRPVRTFSIGFQERSYNELPYARRVAEQYGTEHTELVVTPHVEEVIHQLVEDFDEPFADSSAVATRYVSAAAAGHTKVVLSGDGGDEVFGGYVIYQADKLAGAYRRLPHVLGGRILPAIADRIPASDRKMSWDLKLRRFVAGAGSDPATAHASWRMIFSAEMKDRLYAPGFDRASHDSLDVMRAAFAAYPGPDLLNRFMVVDAKVSLVDDMLTKVDRTSMAHGLEVRVPFSTTNWWSGSRACRAATKCGASR